MSKTINVATNGLKGLSALFSSTNPKTATKGEEVSNRPAQYKGTAPSSTEKKQYAMPAAVTKAEKKVYYELLQAGPHNTKPNNIAVFTKKHIHKGSGGVFCNVPGDAPGTDLLAHGQYYMFKLMRDLNAKAGDAVYAGEHTVVARFEKSENGRPGIVLDAVIYGTEGEVLHTEPVGCPTINGWERFKQLLPYDGIVNTKWLEDFATRIQSRLGWADSKSNPKVAGYWFPTDWSWEDFYRFAYEAYYELAEPTALALQDIEAVQELKVTQKGYILETYGVYVLDGEEHRFLLAATGEIQSFTNTKSWLERFYSLGETTKELRKQLDPHNWAGQLGPKILNYWVDRPAKLGKGGVVLEEAYSCGHNLVGKALQLFKEEEAAIAAREDYFESCLADVAKVETIEEAVAKFEAYGCKVAEAKSVRTALLKAISRGSLSQEQTFEVEGKELTVLGVHPTEDKIYIGKITEVVAITPAPVVEAVVKEEEVDVIHDL